MSNGTPQGSAGWKTAEMENVKSTTSSFPKLALVVLSYIAGMHQESTWRLLTGRNCPQ